MLFFTQGLNLALKFKEVKVGVKMSANILLLTTAICTLRQISMKKPEKIGLYYSTRLNFRL